MQQLEQLQAQERKQKAQKPSQLLVCFNCCGAIGVLLTVFVVTMQREDDFWGFECHAATRSHPDLEQICTDSSRPNALSMQWQLA